MATDEDVTAAREELETAIKRWLRVKAATPEVDDDDMTLTDDPVLLGWITISTYTSTGLEQIESTATAYECGSSQPAPFSRGIAMSGVDRWTDN